MAKDTGGKPNENHDHTGAIKYVPDGVVQGGQILIAFGFRPPFQRLRLATQDDTGPLWVAKHSVNPGLGHRVGIATRWAVLEGVDTSGQDKGPVLLGRDGNWTLDPEEGSYQIGIVLSSGVILLEPGAWPRPARQPESVPNREPEPAKPIPTGKPTGQIPRK